MVMKNKMEYLYALTVCFGLLTSVLLSGGCGGGEGHTHVFDQQTVSDKYFRTEGNCTEETTYYKSCNCGEASTTDYFSAGFKHSSNIIECIKSDASVPLVDYKCLDCGGKTEKVYFDTELKQLPILNIHGELPLSKAAGKSKVQADYYDGNNNWTSYATLKVQGASSSGYPKKNYNVQLYKDSTYDKKNKVTLVEDWGKQSKYTLKANYVDYSQARNVVSGKIYGKIAKSRDLGDGLEKAPNGGAVDGYPVLIFHEGEYLGLYTLNIAKDDWMFGMKDDELPNSALLMADNWQQPVYLTKDITNISEESTEGFVCEYQGDNATDANIISSFNAFTQGLRTVTSKESLHTEVNSNSLKRGMDSMIFTWVICAPDNVAKNILYATYNGNVWLPSVYDMDDSFGLHWNGQSFYDPTTTVVPSASLGTLLWQCLYKYDYDEVAERYKELRNGILSYENIIAEFETFLNKIPDIVRKTENNKWTNVPSQDTNNLDQIKDFTRKRLEFLDKQILRE